MSQASAHLTILCAGALWTASAVFLSGAAQAQQTPLSHEQRYCLGMAGVAAGTIELARAGGRSWPQIQDQLVGTVRKAGWPLGQADFNMAVEIGLTGLRTGDDPKAVAGFILKDCLSSGWYPG